MSFETEFFGPGNRLRWDKLQNGSMSADVIQRLAPFLEALAKNAEVVALPRVCEGDNRVEWYIACGSPRQARIVRDEVRGFLGSSYSDFVGIPSQLDPSDPVEAAVLSKYGTSVFRVGVSDARLFETARERLQLMFQMRSDRPVRYAKCLRPVGRVLRDFEYAVQVGDSAAATECIEELRTAGQLSATNLLFLEVRRLASSRHFDGILALPELDSLLSLPRPRRVTEALIQALYESRLREYEEANLPNQAISVFCAELADRFRDLFKTQAGLRGYEVDASFVLASVAYGHRPSQDFSCILANYAANSRRCDYLESLLNVAAATSTRLTSSTLQDARAAFATADIDTAFELAKGLSPCFERSALMLRCAREMGTLSVAREALATLDSLSPKELDRITQHSVLSGIRDSLLALDSAEQSRKERCIPSDWVSWLRRLTEPTPWKSAVSIAEMASREWDVNELLCEPTALQNTIDLLLTDRPDWAQATFRDALPYFIEFCSTAGTDIRLRSLFDALFLVVAIDSNVSVPQLLVLLRIAEIRLQFGLTQPEYSELLEYLRTFLHSIQSPTVADIALEAMELLINAACPDKSQRERFVVEVISLFRKWYKRIDRSQLSLLKNMSEELDVDSSILGQEANADPGSGAGPWDPLIGKRVAIYSLDEPALRRSEQVLGEVSPTTRVDTFSDSVGGSPSLRTASVAADIFVIAVDAAKHAATTFIEARRPKPLPTLYARGRSSSGILAALRAHLTN